VFPFDSPAARNANSKLSQKNKISLLNITISPQPEEENGDVPHKHCADLSFIEQNRNRLMHALESNNSNNNTEMYKMFVVVRFFRMRGEAIYAILKNGIVVGGHKYNYIGGSNNQLKKKVCNFFRGSVEEIENYMSAFGNFYKLKTASKAAARTGLLFSSCISTIPISMNNNETIPDIEWNGHTFTDGCGWISVDLAKEVAKKLNITHRGEPHVPSIFQIRWAGYKGILGVNHDVPNGTIQTRPSMKKFETSCTELYNLGIVDYSKPYTLGVLNKQFIMLLSALGVPDEIFIERFEGYLRELEQLPVSAEVGYKYLMMKKHEKLADELLMEGLPNQAAQRVLTKIQRQEKERLHKLRIVVAQSRTVFGIADPSGSLLSGECFFQPTINGEPLTLIGGYVVVARNPAYHLGDIRILKVVPLAEDTGQDEFVDCIVFPVQGDVPHPHECSGGDLDGDKFFVCWDIDLIPPKQETPYSYPAATITSRKNLNREHVLRYFSFYNAPLVSHLDRLFNHWADLNGPACDECVKLNALWARAIDAAKTGETLRIPSNLNVSRDVCDAPKKERYVWQTLLRMATEELERYKNHTTKLSVQEQLCPVSTALLQNLILVPEVHLSQFEVFDSLVRWSEKNIVTFEERRKFIVDNSHLVDFSKFSIEQQIYACDKGVSPAVVANALNKSALLTPSQMRLFGLDRFCEKWKLFYSPKNSEDFNTHFLCKALQRFKTKLILLSFSSNESVLAVKISKKIDAHISEDDETDIDDQAQAYFFSRNVSKKIQLNRASSHLSVPYNCVSTSSLFQVFRGVKGNTLFYLKVTPRGVVCSLDIQSFGRRLLNSHSKINKEKFQGIEIFVSDEREDWPTLDLDLCHRFPEEPMELAEEDLILLNCPKTQKPHLSFFRKKFSSDVKKIILSREFFK